MTAYPLHPSPYCTDTILDPTSFSPTFGPAIDSASLSLFLPHTGLYLSLYSSLLATRHLQLHLACVHPHLCHLFYSTHLVTVLPFAYLSVLLTSTFMFTVVLLIRIQALSPYPL
ncbi:hypothetical protein PMIN03_001683 [Paraphaeosphaeria minitans]